jgi:allantoate deiminase
MKERAERAIADCRRIALMTEEPGRTTRRFLTEPTHAVHALLRERMEALGMKVSVDAAGNLRGLWRPKGASAERLNQNRLILGSHIDTVPDAGAFDGVLGVMLAIEWVGIARELRLPLAIEVIAFSEEEGMRYGVPFLGSRAVTGTFDAAMLKWQDANGVTMGTAMRAFGLNPAKIKDAAIEDDVIGFVELHIEQGPVLEAEGIPVAVVEGITGQTRLNLRFTGQANHAGTTPMDLRRDALAAAAEWITTVEKQIRKAASSTDPGIVATVGRIVIEPNAGNVIAGSAEVSFEIRYSSSATRHRWTDKLIADAEAIAKRRGIGFEWNEKLDQRTVRMDRRLSTRLKSAVKACGFPVRTIPSGAGHDAMVMAARVPTAMLFLRSPRGISHHPTESVLEEDVEASLNIGREFLMRLAEEVG